MKKLYSFVLIFALIIVLAVPVNAAEGNGSGWIELLEYTSVLDDGDNWFTVDGSTGSVTIPMHVTKRLRKIDMLLYNPTGQRPSAASVTSGSSTMTLSVLQLGSNLCRVVGYVPNAWYSSITVNFSKSSSAAATYEVLSCKVSPLGVQEFVCDSKVYFLNSVYNISEHIVLDPGTYDHGASTEQFRVTINDWMKYDSISVWGSADGMTIDSIRASLSTSALPISVNYFQYNDAGGWTEHVFETDPSHDYALESGASMSTPFYGKYLFNIFIDLAGVDRALTDPIHLYLTGHYDTAYGATFNCQYVNGQVFIADTTEVSWWQQIKSFFSSQFTSLGSKVSTGFTNVGTWISNQTNTLKTQLVNIYDQIVSGFNIVIDLITEQTRNLVYYLERIWYEIEEDFEKYFGVKDQPALDDLSQNSESISQGTSDIHDFEQSQQDTLNTGFASIQSAVTFTNFATALVFVQRYANMTINGISQYTIVFTLPLFLGLFFYLCSRIPGVTRWKSRPPKSNGGGSP